MADLPHPWRMLEDGRIALAFAMPETPVFVATVLEHNRFISLDGRLAGLTLTSPLVIS